MKTYTHIARLRYIPSALLIVMLLVMATPNLRADYSVTGNLTVSANSTLSGDLQVWSGNTAGNDTVKTGAAAGDWLHYNWD